MAATKGWPTVDLSNTHFYPSQGYKNSLEAYGSYYPTYQKWPLCLLPLTAWEQTERLAAAECRCLRVRGGSQRRRSPCDTSLYLSFSIINFCLFNCWSSASSLALGPNSLPHYFLVKLPVRQVMSKPPRSWRRKVVPDVTPSPPRRDSGEAGHTPPEKEIN